jgi:hypothetical protein
VRRLAAAVGLLAAVGCGASGTPAERSLRDTARHLDDIRSATLDLRMTAESGGASGPVGFAMTGPFALPAKEGLPVANVEVTELRGARKTTTRFVSTGEKAYVVSGGHTQALGSSAVTVGGNGGGLGTLRIDSWLRDPTMTTEGDTQRITAGLNVATAFDDLGRLGERLGTSALAGLRPLDDTAKKALERSARESSVEVVTGKDDHLLRRLVITVTLAGGDDVPSGLRSLVPVTLTLSLGLDAVNEPVHVDAPST